MTAHPSRFMLERFCVGDLAPSEERATASHIDECAGCTTRVAWFREQVEQELEALPPETFKAQLSERKSRGERLASRRSAWISAGAVAMAMAAAFVLVPRATTSDIALKGAGVQVHRNRGGVAKLMEADDRIRSGDALRVVVTLPHAAPIDAWFVDAKGRVDRLLDRAGPLEVQTGEHALPGSGVVEAPCSDMWVVVGLGQAAALTESQLKGLGGHPTSGNDDWVPKGCIARPLRCE